MYEDEDKAVSRAEHCSDMSSTPKMEVTFATRMSSGVEGLELRVGDTRCEIQQQEQRTMYRGRRLCVSQPHMVYACE